MSDPAGDTAGATGPLDVVGTMAAPASFHAADEKYLYLRLRVAGSAVQNGALIDDGWGWELDLDGDRSTYELLISVNGGDNTVGIFKNTVTVTPNDPGEPADAPATFTYPNGTNARVVSAGSAVGGAQDYFVDLAVPWTDLNSVGVQPNTHVYVWAGTSTAANSLNLDLACSSGIGHLSDAGVDIDFPAPGGTITVGGGGGAGGNGGGGSGGSGNNMRTLEGGPGCALAGAASQATAPAWLLAIAALLWWRRRSRAA